MSAEAGSGSPPSPDDFFEVRAGLILSLRRKGITDPRILRAFEQVPHERFVPEDYLEHAYREVSLPIACGQSITSPTLTAAMVRLLQPQEGDKVLEIGTGSGYCAAILSRMSRRVFSLERYRSLAAAAQAVWNSLGYTNIIGLHEDGLTGLGQQAPFDRILLTGSVETPPEAVLDQLADGGIAVMPLGAPGDRQVLVRYERADDDLVESEHGFIRLAPLMSGRARAL